MSDNNSGAEHGALPPAVGQPVSVRAPNVQHDRHGGLQLAQVIGTNQYVLTTQSPNVPPLTQFSTANSPSSNTIARIINISNIRTSNLTNQSIVNALTKPRTPNVRTQLFPTSSDQTGTNLVVTPPAPPLLTLTPQNVAQPPASAPGNPRASPGASPHRKRGRPDDMPPGCENLGGQRARAMEHKWARSKCMKESYSEHCAELYFLESGGNMLDYHAWRKRPRTPHFTAYLRQHQLEPPPGEPVDTATESSHAHLSTPTVKENTPTMGQSLENRLGHASYSYTAPNRSQHQQSGVTRHHSVVLTPLRMPSTHSVPNAPQITPKAPQSAPPILTAVSTTPSTPVPDTKPPVISTPITATPSTSTSTPVQLNTPVITTTTTTNCTSTVVTSVVSTLSSINKPSIATSTPTTSTPNKSTRTSISGFPGSGNAEQIVEKAKQEAYVMQRITELQREGLWTERRLPKVQESQRCKSHWDYLLEEMVWLAADFAQERKWKKAAAKKCARMVQKYFQDKALAAQKAEKAQELQLRRVASFIAKEIKTFWGNVEKLVEFKQQTRLEEKRKQALDQHLSFIVDQTEKYSQLLAEGMNKSGTAPAEAAQKPRSTSPHPHHSDDEFHPATQSSSDDEETIAQAEAADSADRQTEEILALKRESEMGLEDFLNELPKDYLANRDKIVLSENSDNDNSDAKVTLNSDSDAKSTDAKTASVSGVKRDESKRKKDEDFKIDSNVETEDDEDTIMEQEQEESGVDHKEELNDLQEENDMSIEELRKKYLNLPPLPIETEEETTESGSSLEELEESSEEESSEIDSETESKKETEDEAEEVEEEDKLGLKMLVEDAQDSITSDKQKTEGEDDDLINDVAALAESIQPKGNTLSSTSVVTPIPFLLKHSLREYQHIGLDWLVTMYERKLNGILADEMGLGKTIQTIALLAHLACEKGDWGPHLIIVPTSVMLNWEMECKKWCPGFKILTYYGTQKERKLKRTGWTKTNAFHICITSYKLVIQDHQSFRRKKWKYLILDEAQNIKNFKSQRWQLLLNFQTQQRLLLTGTPLQNNLMELWSLMHFLMPNVFQSHREFKEWFSNPVTGMIEGNSEYNESIIKRLHKVLRPFLLRRLKSEVEKQMPQKFEHVVMCRLSKRQRFLYDDYMSRAKTRETLATGNLLSVINVLMQLRKVCNHPNLFEVRPTISPFQMEGIQCLIPSIVYSALDYDFFKHVNLATLYLRIINMEYELSAYGAFRTCKYRAPRKLIELIDDQPEPAPPCPHGLVHMRVKLSDPKVAPNQQTLVSPPKAAVQLKQATPNRAVPNQGQAVKFTSSPVQQGIKFRVAGSGTPLQSYSLQLVSHQGSVKAIPVATISTSNTQSAQTLNLATVGAGGVLKPVTGDQRVQGFAQLVQSQLGKHILLKQSGILPQGSVNISGTTTVMTNSGQRLTVLSKPVTSVTTSVTSVNRNPPSLVNTATANIIKPADVESEQVTTGVALSRPLTASLVQQFRTSGATFSATTSGPTSSLQHIQARHSTSTDKKDEEFDAFRAEWNEKSTITRQSKLSLLHRLNEWRCHASPMYGDDLRDCVAMTSRPPRGSAPWTGAYVNLNQLTRGEKIWKHGSALKELVRTPDALVMDMQDTFTRFVFCVPPVSAKPLSYRVLNPPQSKYWGEKRDEYLLMRELSPKAGILHPIASAMCTQFPDPRLIQYDCGKLQTLDLLLRRLKSGQHRVLIFTQMTRMLDVLEQFLNYHGHIYLRLDGTTKVDQRQFLMERFNGNKKIFCFILSTRSGGVGVNLTGADTVIFYDSDWNPTMDAQAQDRCHRIGQTRDVHIYRLVSEKTIEENILKKANQKRMLGDLAIEGGNFTTAYFKSTTIQDLFNVDQNEDDANARMASVLKSKITRPQVPAAIATTSESGPGISSSSGAPAATGGDDRQALGALENALAACEDDQDVQAARTAKAEAVADLAEFDESIPLEEQHEKVEEMSKAEMEVQNLIKQLSPIERYAMRFVEETEAAWSAEQLAAAEREIEKQKREWEENRLAALRVEEERRARQLEEESELVTFSREDATNQVGKKRGGNMGGVITDTNTSTQNTKLKNTKTQFRRRKKRASIRNQARMARKQFNKRDSVRINENKRRNGDNRIETEESSDESADEVILDKTVEILTKSVETSKKISNNLRKTSKIVVNSIKPPEKLIKSAEKIIKTSDKSSKLSKSVEIQSKTKSSEITLKPPKTIETSIKTSKSTESLLKIPKNTDTPLKTSKSTAFPLLKTLKSADKTLKTSKITLKTSKRTEKSSKNTEISSDISDVSVESDSEQSSGSSIEPETSPLSSLSSPKTPPQKPETSDSSSSEEVTTSRKRVKPKFSAPISESDSSEDEELALALKASLVNNHKPVEATSESESSFPESDTESNFSESNSSDLERKRKKIINKLDHNSPRTRSRGTVKINLWTLDVSPILPGLKPVRSGTPLPKLKAKILKYKAVDKCNNKKSGDFNIIEDCLQNKVSVVMTDVVTQNLLQNNSVSSTSESPNGSETIDSPVESQKNPETFKKPLKVALKNRKLPAHDQKSLDSWLQKLPASTDSPTKPDSNIRTRRSSMAKLSSDDAEPVKKLIKIKNETSNGPVT